jgi:hypothetical protein
VRLSAVQGLFPQPASGGVWTYQLRSGDTTSKALSEVSAAGLADPRTNDKPSTNVATAAIDQFIRTQLHTGSTAYWARSG